MDPGGFGFTVEASPRAVTSESVFGNDRPLELEIGCGKGTFLLAESERRPNVNLIGIEYARKYWSYTADRLRRHERSNARAVLAEAESFVRDYVEEATLAAVHIYFPDPWPKKRHQKRRLVSADFVATLTSKMGSGAKLQIATDHEAYFVRIAAILEASPLTVVPFDSVLTAESGENVGTNFERKYLRQGRRVFTIAARVGIFGSPSDSSHTRPKTPPTK